MKTRFLGCGMVVLSILVALLWIQITEGRQEVIRIIIEAGTFLGVFAVAIFAMAGFLLIVEGGKD